MPPRDNRAYNAAHSTVSSPPAARHGAYTAVAPFKLLDFRFEFGLYVLDIHIECVDAVNEAVCGRGGTIGPHLDNQFVEQWMGYLVSCEQHSIVPQQLHSHRIPQRVVLLQNGKCRRVFVFGVFDIFDLCLIRLQYITFISLRLIHDITIDGPTQGLLTVRCFNVRIPTPIH